MDIITENEALQCNCHAATTFFNGHKIIYHINCCASKCMAWVWPDKEVLIDGEKAGYCSIPNTAHKQ